MRIIDNAVQNCAAIVEWAESEELKSKWAHSTTFESAEPEERTSDTLFYPFLSYELPDVIEAANRAVWRHLDQYGKDFGQGFYTVESVSLQRYTPGQRYEVHTDYTQSSDRVFSAVLYLNTLRGGGQTRFPLVDVEVTPRAGRLAIFPANFVFQHEALPPKSGVKYASAFWVRG